MVKRAFSSIRYVLLAMAMVVMPAALAQVRISITIAPPELPVYDQPICPGEGYIWAPGYWAWDADYDDYYWVPGTWVEAPEVGFYWTPGYWGWEDGSYLFHDGYWGPEVGFYGGINYGFGYFGEGYEGGRWSGGHFEYNRAVNNIDANRNHYVYDQRVTNRTETRVSYNGGNGGVNVRPTAQDEAAARQRHIAPVAAQTQHVQAARSDQQFRASVNHGKPAVAATSRPGAFSGQGVVPAKVAGTVHTAPPGSAGNNGGSRDNSGRPTTNETRPATPESRPSGAVMHAKDLPPVERPTPPSTGNPKTDQKYQQQQQQLQQKQGQERQKLQQKQDQDHQRLAQQKANSTQQQQVEQRHQQQTQQLQQKHVQQQQKLQQRQQPPQPQKKAPPKGPPHG